MKGEGSTRSLIAFSIFRYIVTVSFLLAFSTNVFAQAGKQVEIEQANSLEGVKINGVEIRRLVGDVVFKQNDTRMFCDSALFNEQSNTIDAFGTIRVENPKAKLFGDVLHYDGNTKKAIVTGKIVRMTDGKMTLTTDQILYDMGNDIGEYNTGGKVEDNENVLTSKKGYYYSKEQAMYFRENVVLNNPRYFMTSDTLRYHMPTETAYFLGPSQMNSKGTDSGFVYCEYGWYNTKAEKSYFSKNAYLRSKENFLRGDSLLYDRKNFVGEAWHHVSITDTINKTIVSGDYAKIEDKKGKSFVTGETMLTKIFETDSMFLHADTLYATGDTVSKEKTYLAYKHTRIFKPDLQGQCDSLVYHSKDSTIAFVGNPILWSGKNQLTADMIVLQLANNKMQSLFLKANAFIVGQEDSLRFNQVKGRDMTGYFTDNHLTSIKVQGNGQTVYYIRNGKKQLSGVNKADCSDMLITVDGSKVKKIALINQPDATLFPVKELPPNELRLKNFAWYGTARPLVMEDIFHWNQK